MSSNTFPLLHTTDYVLREIVASDLPSIFHGLSNPQVTQWFGLRYDTVEATQDQMDWYREIVQQQTGIWWAISRNPGDQEDTTGDLLGTCGLYDRDTDNQNADIGFWLHPQHWGQGILPQCLPAVLRYGFEQLNLHRIEAEVEPQNLASGKLLRNIGFQFEGTRRQVARRGARFVDLEYYGVLRGG
jgi:ribosomal-protein-alanine N-acetyltransferase